MKPKFIKKRKRLLEGEYELWSPANERDKQSKLTPEIIEHKNEWILNHPQVLN